jgi:hypothetical protein
MTKTKKGVDYSKVTPALAKQVKDVIADADKHTYSVSKVYAAHNAVFGLRETPQTCSSCLRNRARNLREWFREYDEYVQTNIPKPEAPPTDNEGTGEDGKAPEDGDTKPDPEDGDLGYVPQAEGTVRYPMAEGAPFDFLPNEGTIVKGMAVRRADGSRIKSGKYFTAEGLEIAVQPGGKASIKEVEDLT